MEKRNPKKDETLFEDTLACLRDRFFMVLEDRKMGHSKKRIFDKSHTRCMQSKINLKFPIQTMLKEKVKEPIQIKEGFIQEFDKHYQEMCNHQYQRSKNRNVSPDNPFDKHNQPPKQYLEYDYAIPKNPTKLDPKEIDISNVPLAGRLTEVGQRILALGGR